MQLHTSDDVPGNAVSPHLSTSSTKQSLMREQEAARLLDHSVATLRKWRVKGGGPRYVKISRRSVRYRHLDLMDWIEHHLVRNTSEVLQ